MFFVVKLLLLSSYVLLLQMDAVLWWQEFT
jgi:hypothetical protein